MTADTPAEVAAEPMADDSELATPEGAVGDSLSVATWTTISRVTGVLRGVVVAAVLGATYFANTYQFTNSLPNLIFYGLLAGSLFSSLLAPALVAAHRFRRPAGRGADRGRATRDGAVRHAGARPDRGGGHPVAAPARLDRRRRSWSGQ